MPYTIVFTSTRWCDLEGQVVTIVLEILYRLFARINMGGNPRMYIHKSNSDLV